MALVLTAGGGVRAAETPATSHTPAAATVIDLSLAGSLERIRVEVEDHCKPAAFEGMRLSACWHARGVPLGEAMRGRC